MPEKGIMPERIIEGILQGFSEDAIVRIRCGCFHLKILASIMDSAFCGLHKDKYTKYSPHKNCVKSWT